MAKFKIETCSHKVLSLLRTRGDFLNEKQIAAFSGCNANQVSASLHHLRKHHAADVVIEADGRGWWFALPIENDTRSKVLLERTPESKPRSRGKKKGGV